MGLGFSFAKCQQQFPGCGKDVYIVDSGIFSF